MAFKEIELKGMLKLLQAHENNVRNVYTALSENVEAQKHSQTKYYLEHSVTEVKTCQYLMQRIEQEIKLGQFK